MDTEQAVIDLDVHKAAKDIIGTIDKEREREIISRRFGLYDRKETLEQIGELLGITRERVRQLEKATLTKMKATASDLPHMAKIEEVFTAELEKLGRVAPVKVLAKGVMDQPKREDNSHIAFLSELAPNLNVLGENDDFYHSVAIAQYHPIKDLKATVSQLVKDVKKHGKPMNARELHAKISSLDKPEHATAVASTSKHLTSLKGQWGHIKWPLVNPKNIRDKIYVILQENGKSMHFNEISEAIKDSDFKRKDVTTQAIHNELIKDKRFVLIGRGIYALQEWGYSKGTVADVIADVLTEAGEPLHRDEIVKRVLKDRHVKETTILLNLQSKPQFVRTAKATYTYDETKV
ncbi:hypothetical protein KBB17_01180 [Candidatus Saccharibacteria bacterium]|jgi:transcriptional regulator with XRE-family HTH domain|nr:hypothetical protein [Candidatus Saccharibacteria bacterium]MBP9132023.1 hypothetical protein [Candidatus Saccharibacteria bacterium]